MSTESLFSAHWHRVRDVRPRLADDVVINRHVYRNRPCHVLQRRSTNVCHRLDTASFELVARLDGRTSISELWDRMLLELDADAPTQDALTTLMAELHAAELLVVDGRVPTEQLFERREKRRARERRERHTNPLYLRFALHDPDGWLTHCTPLAHAIFSRTVFLLWLALLGSAIAALIVHGDEFARAVANPDLLSPRTALLFVLVYPPLKLLHELGHALAIKRAGGAVHEIGVALMVLMPLPYVDASASAAFPDKADRMLVSAAGILVELAFAALGALLWVGATGVLGEIGFVLLLSGGLSTLLLNGNPLLRFDGYYLLADWLEIPNLATRSRRAVFSALRTTLVGKADDSPVVEDRRERFWLFGYGVSSASYRTGLMLWIAWWLSGRFFVFGLALAVFAIVMSVLVPLARGFAAVQRDPALHDRRPLVLLMAVPAVLVALVSWLPLPHASVTRGVVWLPDEAVVRATSGCEIGEAPAEVGTDVSKGDVLFDCHDPELVLVERELQARLDELDARIGGLAVSDPLAYERLEPERRATLAALTDMRVRIDAGLHVAALDGRFDTSGTSTLEGRALARGEIAGYVVPPDRRSIRVALGERAMGRFDAEPSRVEIRVAAGDGTSRVHRSSIVRRTPRSTRTVPNAALSTAGGGEHAIDPTGDGRLLLEPVVDFELAWPEALAAAPIGEHVGVRFVHAPTPLAGRVAEALRRAFDRRGRA